MFHPQKPEVQRSCLQWHIGKPSPKDCCREQRSKIQGVEVTMENSKPHRLWMINKNCAYLFNKEKHPQRKKNVIEVFHNFTTFSSKQRWRKNGRKQKTVQSCDCLCWCLRMPWNKQLLRKIGEDVPPKATRRKPRNSSLRCSQVMDHQAPVSSEGARLVNRIFWKTPRNEFRWLH